MLFTNGNAMKNYQSKVLILFAVACLLCMFSFQ